MLWRTTTLICIVNVSTQSTNSFGMLLTYKSLQISTSRGFRRSPCRSNGKETLATDTFGADRDDVAANWKLVGLLLTRTFHFGLPLGIVIERTDITENLAFGAADKGVPPRSEEPVQVFGEVVTSHTQTKDGNWNSVTFVDEDSERRTDAHLVTDIPAWHHGAVDNRHHDTRSICHVSGRLFSQSARTSELLRRVRKLLGYHLMRFMLMWFLT